MFKWRAIALFVASATVLGGLILLVERGGAIAWSASIFGIALLVKIWRKPARRDLVLSLGLAGISILTWLGTHYYVITTWESGEVVELTIHTEQAPHTVRLWVLELGSEPVVYYDAEPQVANSLLAGKPVQFSRGGEVSSRIPQATRVDALQEAEANEVLEAMNAKYGARNNAAFIYYALLGRARDRVALVVKLVEA